MNNDMARAGGTAKSGLIRIIFHREREIEKASSNLGLAKRRILNY